MTHQKIAVIGCGWLGSPLAKTLVKAGYKVHGSTTTKSKLAVLEAAQIKAFLIQLSSEGITGDLQACLSGCETLILNIPPGLSKNPDKDYVQQMSYVVKTIEASSVKQVLFISSTSVYDDEESFPIITETSATSASKKAAQLIKVERLFQQHKSFKTTLLRFSGLFAEDRHPARFLSGKTNLKNADAPVNLIHREDCIAIIITLLQLDIWDATFNASTPIHPTKKDYYTSECNRLQIAIPEFDETKKSQGKIIDSNTLVRLLNYDFKVKL
ncbi:NAD(P)H-binding protein [Psychroserpens sp. SPM9]|uniref:NAD(P)H-binding protein n=1 Tax=Psychroserpens sp. SPM9 TaxID=2975598 RepID=UPI0021A548AF|nr:NAD(P)H-binding protein [Psychroserpens sp. SPM9]MDG5490545.1 NAD(P)H-binding protein [Psychroserpens sp. SPM9]